MVPHTHYDAVWVFTKEDYLYINELILQKAVELMRSSNYKFCLEQTYLLEALETRNPSLWQALKDLVQQGKLEIVDGTYLMPDTMLTNGELLVRDINLGKRYCREKLGIDVPVAWAADGFGLNAQMPQIYKKSGYRWLAFRRGAVKKVSEFYWKGLDGTSILSHWMPLGYRAGLFLDKLEDSYNVLNKLAATSRILMPSGSGSTPPQEDTLSTIRRWNRTHQDSKIKMAKPSEFFSDLEKTKIKFETLKGEMYSGLHSKIFTDVASSRMWIKLGERRYEDLIYAVETFATLTWLMGEEYPESGLNDAWRKMMFVALHDVLSGTGMDQIYEEVRSVFSSLEHQLGNMLSNSLTSIAKRVNTGGDSVVIFNPLPWRVTDWVDVDLDLSAKPMANPRLSYDGKHVDGDLMVVSKDENGLITRAHIGFPATVPPLGYRTYNIVENGDKERSKFEISGNEIVNRFFKVRVNGENGTVRIFHKDGRPLTRGNEIVIEEECGDLYNHKTRLNRPIKTDGGEGSVFGVFKRLNFTVQEGVEMAKVRLEEEFYNMRWPYRLSEDGKTVLYRYPTIKISKEIMVYRDLPRIDFVTRISNRCPYIRIRAKFETDFEVERVAREVQFGVIEQSSKEISEIGPESTPPTLNWISCYGKGRGVTVLNRGIPANEVRDNSIYLTLIRSIGVLCADGESGPFIPTPDALELRDYVFEFSLCPHIGDWRQADSHRQAHQFNRRFIPVRINGQGDDPREGSFIQLKPSSLMLSAFKRSDDGSGSIVRFYETEGRKTEGDIRFHKKVKEAYETDLLENETKRLEPHSNRVKIEINPYEVKSLKIML
ncbi:MAG: alpha-mannosidase [Nitrososphaerales archaeon]